MPCVRIATGACAAGSEMKLIESVPSASLPPSGFRTEPVK